MTRWAGELSGPIAPLATRRPGMRQLRQAPDALHSNARASAVTLSGMVGFPDFDQYVEEHGIPEEHYPAAFAG